MTAISFLRYCGLLVVVAAAPIPLLVMGHVVEPGDGLRWFLSYLAVAIVASRMVASDPPLRV